MLLCTSTSRRPALGASEPPRPARGRPPGRRRPPPPPDVRPSARGDHPCPLYGARILVCRGRTFGKGPNVRTPAANVGTGRPNVWLGAPSVGTAPTCGRVPTLGPSRRVAVRTSGHPDARTSARSDGAPRADGARRDRPTCHRAVRTSGHRPRPGGLFESRGRCFARWGPHVGTWTQRGAVRAWDRSQRADYRPTLGRHVQTLRNLAPYRRRPAKQHDATM